MITVVRYARDNTLLVALRLLCVSSARRLIRLRVFIILRCRVQKPKAESQKQLSRSESQDATDSAIVLFVQWQFLAGSDASQFVSDRRLCLLSYRRIRMRMRKPPIDPLRADPRKSKVES